MTTKSKQPRDKTRGKHKIVDDNNRAFFRLDALAKALSVSYSDVAGWLAGWLGGWLSHSGIVSKPLNLSENFFDHLKAPSF